MSEYNLFEYERNWKKYKTYLRDSEKYKQIFSYLIPGIKFLTDEGLIPKGNSKHKIVFLEGNLPSKYKGTGGKWWDSAFTTTIEKKNGQKIEAMVIDDSLTNSEGIYQVLHEYMHFLYPKLNEHDTQVKTARCLLDISRNHDTQKYKKYFEKSGITSEFLSKDDISWSYASLLLSNTYGLNNNNIAEEIKKSRKVDKGSRLESIIKKLSRSLGITSIILFISSVLFNPSITGNVIGASNSNNLSIFLIFLGFISGLFYLFLAKNPIV